MKVRILLVRHGETPWNRQKIFRGTYDIPLNDNGRKQATLVQSQLNDIQVDTAYTSPLSRAAETAEIALRPQGLTATVAPELIDFNYGAWTGKKDDAVAQEWPKEHAIWCSAAHTAQPPEGDTLEELSARAFAFIQRVTEQSDGKTIVFFAHRVINKVLVLRLLDLSLKRFAYIRQDNCCINEFEWTGDGYVVVRLNDTSHLRNAGTNLLTADF